MRITGCVTNPRRLILLNAKLCPKPDGRERDPKLVLDTAPEWVHNGGMMTNWPEAPENIRPLLDAIELSSPIPKTLRKRWLSSAHRYAECVGTDPELLMEAIAYMEKRDLMHADLNSVITVALLLKQRGRKTAIISDVCPECGAAFGGHARDCEAI